MSYPALVSDAGHGGYDAGAIGVNGLRESSVTLQFSLRFAHWFKELTVGVVKQTREVDTYVGLSDRARIANTLGVPLISWHCNAYNKSANGVEAFTSPGETNSDPLATAMLEAYINENPDVAQRFDLSDGDPDKESRFTVLTKTNKEAVLFELGFIDSPKDHKFLSDYKWIDRNAKVQASVIAEYFGFTFIPENPAETYSIEQRLRRLEKLHPEMNS
tara:strand:- start:33297 stop:33947 length:651 start_codon:yes stop_codon:yes gene_type:complete